MTARSLAVFLSSSMLLAATVAQPAGAQGTSVDAEELFKQGRTALDVGDYKVACEKLAASLAIERAVGTLMSLGKCEEATNKLASARQHWQEAGDLADASHDRLRRGPACREKFTALDARVPRLTLRLAAAAPTTTTLTRDGVAIVTAALNTALPVDPGTHTVEVRAPGHALVTLRVELAEGQHKTIDAAPGPVEKPIEVAITGGTEATSTGTGSAPEVAPSTSTSMPRGVLFWSGVGVAGAGTVAGVISGAVALGAASSLSQNCPHGVCSSGAGQSSYNTASAAAIASDVSFGLAAAGAVLAVVELVRHSRASSKQPTASPWIGPGGAGVKATF